MPRRPKPVDGKLFAKSRREGAERVARLERLAKERAAAAAQAAWIAWVASQEEQTVWTPERARKVEVARQAASEAADWAVAATSAARDVANQWDAREAHYTKAEAEVAKVLNKITRQEKEDD